MWVLLLEECSDARVAPRSVEGSIPQHGWLLARLIIHSLIFSVINNCQLPTVNDRLFPMPPRSEKKFIESRIAQSYAQAIRRGSTTLLSPASTRRRAEARIQNYSSLFFAQGGHKPPLRTSAPRGAEAKYSPIVPH